MSNILLQTPPVPHLVATIPHVLVVDDDAGVRTLIARLLRQSGYEVTSVECGAELRAQLAARRVDLVLLDIMMPGENGLDLCRDIRTRSNVPIIMVSARGKEADRVTGLDLGADDYIAKPFGRSELLARVRAVLRRPGDPHLPSAPASPERYGFAGWQYRPRHQELLAPSGAQVDLTGAEHELLRSLLGNPQRIIGRERLLELARTRRGHRTDRSIDVLISRLRSKLGDGKRPKPFIRTIRGIGYMFCATVTAE